MEQQELIEKTAKLVADIATSRDNVTSEWRDPYGGSDLSAYMATLMNELTELMQLWQIEVVGEMPYYKGLPIKIYKSKYINA